MQGTGEQAQLEMPPALLEPNFERLNSGLYGYLSTRAGRTVWHSNSAQLRPELPATGEFPQPGDLLLDQIEHFFNHYKALEKDKWVKLNGWGDASKARGLIEDAIAKAKA